MRILLELSPPNKPLGFDYPHRLCRVLHKWLGLNNPWHDSLSLYSFGWLEGGRGTSEGLIFPDGASWFVSGWEEAFLARLVTGVFNDRELLHGMHVRTTRVAQTPVFKSRQFYRVSGPVLLKSLQEDRRVKFLTFQDGELADEALTHSIHSKLEAAGLARYIPDVRAHFVADHATAKTKLVEINGIRNRASLCPIVVEGPEEVQRFVWRVGVGNCTGVGFGGLK